MSIISVYTDGAKCKDLSVGGCIITDNESTSPMVHKLLGSKVKISLDSTNNEGELFGIMMALDLLDGNNKDPYYLYSDSEYCVNSLNNWILNWFNTYELYRINKILSPKMMGSSGEPVKNCRLFCTIINTIVHKNINIRFMHIKGHLSPYKHDDILKQIKYMEKLNPDTAWAYVDAQNTNSFNEMIDSLVKEKLINYKNGIYFMEDKEFYDDDNTLINMNADWFKEKERYFLLNKAIMNKYRSLIM